MFFNTEVNDSIELLNQKSFSLLLRSLMIEAGCILSYLFAFSSIFSIGVISFILVY